MRCTADRRHARARAEVVEYACSGATLTLGDTMDNIAADMDIYSFREPLGVVRCRPFKASVGGYALTGGKQVAGISPFNFPAMIPLWMFPLAITCGNSFVLKPSEKDPSRFVRERVSWACLEGLPGV